MVSILWIWQWFIFSSISNFGSHVKSYFLIGWLIVLDQSGQRFSVKSQRCPVFFSVSKKNQGLSLTYKIITDINNELPIVFTRIKQNSISLHYLTIILWIYEHCSTTMIRLSTRNLPLMYVVKNQFFRLSSEAEVFCFVCFSFDLSHTEPGNPKQFKVILVLDLISMFLCQFLCVEAKLIRF